MTAAAIGPFAAPMLFFAGWIGAGLLAAWLLVRRGHDRRISYAMGAGMGPLMLVASGDSVTRRDPSADVVVIGDARRLGGTTHLVVMVGSDPRGVVDVVPTLEALRPELASVRVVKAVTYEALDDGAGVDPSVELARRELDMAASLLPVDGVGKELYPGTVDSAASAIRALPRRLVVFAPDDC